MALLIEAQRSDLAMVLIKHELNYPCQIEGRNNV